jgi:hypothetical protein
VFLDEAYAKATTPFARMTFIWPRAEVYAWLGRPLDLVDVEQLAAEPPRECDSARLALPQGRQARRGGAVDRQGPHARLRSAQGPLARPARRDRRGRGDRAAERRDREQAVALWESLPDGHKSAENLAQAKAARDAHDAGSAP